MKERIFEATFEFMIENESRRQRPSLSGMLKYLGVSRSGYNAWLNRKPSKTEARRNEIKKHIQKEYDDSFQNYGAPKITKILRKQGYRIAERTVGTYMSQMGIHAQWIKRWVYYPNSKSVNEEVRNLLKQKFNPRNPNAVWCTDITYIWTANGFVYLTSVMDLYSRKIIAWTLSEDMKAESIVEAINKARKRRDISRTLIIHSDRGSQYISAEYKKATKKINRSYSAKGYPYDNACIEAFHSLIKREWLKRYLIWDFQQAYQLCFEYIETFYNTKRIHSHCDYMSPNDFERIYFRSCSNIKLAM